MTDINTVLHSHNMSSVHTVRTNIVTHAYMYTDIQTYTQTYTWTYRHTHGHKVFAHGCTFPLKAKWLMYKTGLRAFSTPPPPKKKNKKKKNKKKNTLICTDKPKCILPRDSFLISGVAGVLINEVSRLMRCPD